MLRWWQRTWCGRGDRGASRHGDDIWVGPMFQNSGYGAISWNYLLGLAGAVAVDREALAQH